MYLKTNILTIKISNGGKDKINILDYHNIVKDKIWEINLIAKEGKRD